MKRWRNKNRHSSLSRKNVFNPSTSKIPNPKFFLSPALSVAEGEAEGSNIDKPYAVRALVVQAGEILFIQHNNPALFDKWTFPGGRLDPDETEALAALHREIQEELAVEIEVLGKLGRYYSRAGRDYTIFAARPLGSIGPLQPDEIREVVWLTPAEIYEWHCQEKLQFGFEMAAVSAYLKKFG